MAYTLADYFAKHGLIVIEGSLKRVVGTPTSYVKDEATYRMHVIQPGWSALPAGIRMQMKRHVQAWDDLYEALRVEVLDLRGALIELRPGASARIASLVPIKLGFTSSPVVGQAASLACGLASAAACPTSSPAAGGAQAKGVVELARVPPAAGSAELLRVPLQPSPSARAIPVAMPVAQPTSQSVPLAKPIVPPATASAETDSDPVVGIDLGTTFSVIAHVDAQGRPYSLLNLDGERLTPSVVQFGDDDTVVGKQAVLRSAFEPDRTAVCVKRDMGAKFYRRQINGEFLPPEVISALILRSLKEDAERPLGPIRRAVITVPAYFDETRRRATMDAGRLAGLEVLDIINEPTAAAIAYGHQLGFLDHGSQPVGGSPLRVLVFDLGGGTFDVTIVEIGHGAFKALATDGDVTLGGRDWDEKLLEIAAERFCAQLQTDPRDDPISAQELWLAAESAKRTLSERQKATLRLNHAGARAHVEVTREEFEQATAPLLERTRLTTEIVVRQAGLTFADLDRILLVGGSTRMPMVVRMLEELSGKPVDRSVSADEAVAHGAALYANLLASPKTAGESAEFTVTDVNSHSLGILGTDPRTGAKFNKILIPKNTPLPRTVAMPFKTYRLNQHQILIKILEGESEKPNLCTQLGVCTIADLPAELPAGWPIEVSYTCENNGQLRLTAQLAGYPKGVSTSFARENRLPDEDLEIWAGYVEEELSGANA